MSATPPLPGPSDEAMRQAAAWFSLLHGGKAGEADRGRWRAWLEASADARAAWRLVERISQRFEPLQAADPQAPTAAATDADTPRLAAETYRRASLRLGRRRALGTIALTAGAGLLGLASWRHGERATQLASQLGAHLASQLSAQWAAWLADHGTGTGETRTVMLEDGSRVRLDTATAFDQRYDSSERLLRLRAGAILVETGAGDSRPFIVVTPHGRLLALGTRFTVRLEGHSDLVAVFDGAVRIDLPGRLASAVVDTGQQRHFDDRTIGPASQADAGAEAWSRGILVANGRPLAGVVAELRRYHRGYLGLAPELADLPVLGSYPLGDTDAALRMLESVLPIRIERLLPGWTTIEARSRPGPGG